jgi:hypothetical protein
MAETLQQIELNVGSALECAERATWTINELVGRTLETAVTGREVATTLHHESRPRKSGRDDRWSLCLTAGTLCPSNQETR